MNITIIGRGHIGGALAKRLERAGHVVQALGHQGGDASHADALIVAAPSGAIAEALGRVSGIAGKPTVDVTNAYTGRDERFQSLSHEIKSIVGGPVAKAFNTIWYAVYDAVDDQRVRPSCLFAAETEARPLTEQLIRDVGFDPVYLGGLEKARTLEELQFDVHGAISKGGLGSFFYRYAKPGEL